MVLSSSAEHAEVSLRKYRSKSPLQETEITHVLRRPEIRESSLFKL